VLEVLCCNREYDEAGGTVQCVPAQPIGVMGQARPIRQTAHLMFECEPVSM